MAKVTSKLQLTVPKVIADQYEIRPGDELEWVPAGDAIRVIPPHAPKDKQPVRSAQDRLKLFHEMLARQRRREADSQEIEIPAARLPKPHEVKRGWRREDLYTRGRPR